MIAIIVTLLAAGALIALELVFEARQRNDFVESAAQPTYNLRKPSNP
ncbi:MAG: hypothetical protein JNM94_12980 [Phycisphaerae bacterium]|nr:hypothetical protein [Phycisphaerae bacterium]